MTTYTISSGYDAYAISIIPGLNTGAWSTVNVSTLTERGFIYFPLPADIAGQTIASATLTGTTVTSSAPTIDIKLITSPWAEGTITWNQQPTVGAATSSLGIGGGAITASIPITTLIQAVASGQAWYGLRLTTTAGSAHFQSFDSGQTSWVLTIDTVEAPETPQSLVPNGTVVGSGAPVVTCDFQDNGGLSNDMAAMNVQISTTTSFTSPVYDQTGNTTVPVFDLSSPPSPATAFTAISSGSSRYWRVRVQDTDGNWSGFSDPAQFTYRTQPTITLLSPAAGVLWDPTSDILASSSANMSAYRVQITDGNDRTAIRYDSGRLPANPSALTSIAVSLPQEYHGSRVLVDDRDYQLHIRIWDTFTNRQTTTDSPAYVDSWSTFHFDDDLTITPITTLVVDQPVAGAPQVQLTWTRAAAPDGWVVLRDDKVIARLDPADVIVGASTYSWTDSYPPPWLEHTYSVKAITNGTPNKVSAAGPTAAIIPEILGVWLYAADGSSVAVDGGDTSQLVINDRRTTYKPINLRYDVDIVTGFEGLSGTFTAGVIPSAVNDQDLSDARAVLQSMKENPSSPVMLIYGTFAGRVLLRNISMTPDPRGNVGTPLMAVSFGVNQVADFD